MKSSRYERVIMDYTLSKDQGSGGLPSPLRADETDALRIICAPLQDSLPLLTRRLLAAERRIAELEAKLGSEA